LTSAAAKVSVNCSAQLAPMIAELITGLAITLQPAADDLLGRIGKPLVAAERIGICGIDQVVPPSADLSRIACDPASSVCTPKVIVPRQRRRRSGRYGRICHICMVAFLGCVDVGRRAARKSGG
jgi:hypothetical protein